MIFRRSFFILFLLFFLFSSGKHSTAETPENWDIVINQISSKQILKHLKNNKKFLFVDVRTYEEREMSQIPESIFIPLNELHKRFGELKQYKDENILVYDSNGRRSFIACEILLDQGFKKIYNLVGGIEAWEKEKEKNSKGKQAKRTR